ncbi:MAG: ketopantoate reductase family protein, partial [Deltaproteobacteria bacterium]|nr:ketopantoate reductase family protein [Deltaproteobacteria bacterium]
MAISPNMDAWLKTHVAEVIPVANAIYMAGGDNYRLARTRDGLVLMVRAIREGYRVLRALGVPITPANHKIFNWIPELILVALMRRILNTKTAEIEMAGHANAARDEM